MTKFDYLLPCLAFVIGQALNSTCAKSQEATRTENLRIAVAEAAPSDLVPIPLGRPLDSVETLRIHTVKEFRRQYPEVTGEAISLSVFDMGAVRATHQEFTTDRIENNIKNSRILSDHATNVASVLVARGKADAVVGLAPGARLLIFESDPKTDLECLDGTAHDIQISNHSYGLPFGWHQNLYREFDLAQWHGDDSHDEDANFGKYGPRQRALDSILYENPHLVTFVSAGNERGGRFPQAGEPHRVFSTKKESRNVRKRDDFDRGGLDTLCSMGIAKNALCIGSVGPLSSNADLPRRSSFSSWGPTDDGRVKPDLVAIGENIKMANAAGDTSYAEEVSGTSFATPAASGMAACLVELFEKRLGRRPTSAAIRALLIHTAEDDAQYPGPDPVFGWGVIKMLEAARFVDKLSKNDRETKLMIQSVSSPEDTIAIPFSNRFSSSDVLRVTLAWIDPPGDVQPLGVVDDRSSVLQNDLDVTVVAPDGRVFFPYVLDQANPLNEPERSRNSVDNVEVIDISPEKRQTHDSKTKESWRAIVSVSKLFADSKAQEFAILISGVKRPMRDSEMASKEPLFDYKEPQWKREEMPMSWKLLGPFDFGGPTRSLAIHPSSPRRIFAACTTGGIWRSDDAGESWSLSSHPNVPVTALAIAPDNPDLIFAGTGLKRGYEFYKAGIGILKSEDNGREWKLVKNTEGFDFRFINHIAVAPDDVLLVATHTGLFRSTGDRSKKFVHVIDHEILEVKFHPEDHQRCMASGSNGNVYCSNDQGITWTQSIGLTVNDTMSSSFRRTDFAYAASAPDVVYALVDSESKPFEAVIYRSKNSGKSFTQVAKGKYLDDSGFYASVIWAGDPNDPDLVLVGSSNLYRSVDGGKNFKQITTGNQFRELGKELPAKALPIHFQCLVSLKSNNEKPRVLLGSDGGLHEIANVRTIESLFDLHQKNRGYHATEVLSVAADRRMNRIVVGTGANGTMTLDSTDAANLIWRRVFAGQGGNCAVNPTQSNQFYGQYGYQKLFKTRDGATTDVFPIMSDNQIERGSANWNPPFILDPSNPERLLFGARSLYRLGGKLGDTPKRIAGTPISAIESPGLGASELWVGHNNGNLYFTKDISQTTPEWIRVDERLTSSLPDRYCTSIALDPSNHNTVFVTFAGHHYDNLWVTRDCGKNWQSISLPPVPLNDAFVAPGNSKLVFVASETGMFFSTDGGLNWSATSSGPGDVAVRQLAWTERGLLAATAHGVYLMDRETSD